MHDSGDTIIRAFLTATVFEFLVPSTRINCFSSWWTRMWTRTWREHVSIRRYVTAVKSQRKKTHFKERTTILKVRPHFVYESPIFLHHDHDIESTRPLRVKIGDSFTKSDFVQSKIDLCVYREMKNGVISCIIIYVDDLLITLI